MTQLRRNVPAELRALFNSGAPIITADLITLTLSGGTVFRWTSADRPITLDGATWSLGPGVETGKMKWTAGIEVDSLNLLLYGDASTQINDRPMMQFINGGGLDGAKVQAWRAFAPSPQNGAYAIDWVGRLHRFTGSVSDIDRPSKVEASITVRSIFELLNQQLPRNIYESQCSNTLYDTGCGVNRISKTVTATVTAANDPLRLSFASDGLSQAAGYFDLGAVRFISGGNTGVLRTVRRFETGVVQLVQPWPVQPVVGDTFQIYPGCDLSLTTCSAKYGNSSRFGGQPYIPVAETVL